MKNRRTRIDALIVASLALAVFVMLAIFAKAHVFDGVNRAVAALENSTWTAVAVAIGAAAKWYVWLIVAVVLVVVRKTRADFGVPLTVAVAGAAMFGFVAKKLLHVARPPQICQLTAASGYGFPSAHTLVATAFLGAAVYFLWRAKIAKGWKIFATIFAAALILVIGFSRIYLGVHSLSDVLGGVAAGVFIVAATVFLKTLVQISIRRRS